MAWTLSTTVTIDHTQVGASNSTDFPMLFGGTYPQLATVANGGYVTSSSGYDIIFATDAGGTSPLAFDRAAWNAVTGESEFWVKIPTLSHTVDTVIYILVGNAAVTTDQQDKAGTWSSSFSGVYHLEDNAASKTLVDSSGNARNMVNYFGNTNTNAVAAQIETGQSYEANDSAHGTGPNLANILTISGWFKAAAVGLIQVLLGNEEGVTSLGANAKITAAAKLAFSLGGVADYAFSMTVSTGTWYYFAVTSSGNGGTAHGYLAPVGGSVTTDSKSIGTMSGTPDQFLLCATGNGAGPDNLFNGIVDEMRLSSVVRSADWIIAEFNNQSSPATFYDVNLVRQAPILISKLVAFAMLDRLAGMDVSKLVAFAMLGNPSGTVTNKAIEVVDCAISNSLNLQINCP